MDAESKSNVRPNSGAGSDTATRLEEELTRCREEVRLKTLRLNEFLAYLEQKLRAPLTAIIGFAELIELQCDNETTADNAKQILKAARDLLAVINRELAESNQARVAVNVAATLPCDVLYIEDDPANFALVQGILEERPVIKLLQASRGDVGLDLAATHSPKLILLDLNLPDMHGFELLQRIRQNEATANIPVVVISGDATATQIERLLSAGARNYVTKPFSIRPFLSVIDEVLEGTERTN
jgi:CheY-like chemotaxis protein